MCTVCGCSDGGAKIEPGPAHTHQNDHGHGHAHDHHHHSEDGALNFGAGPAGVHVAGHSQARLIEIEQNILSKNDVIAAQNRARLEAQGIIAINLMSSPGSGKTTLLVETIKRLKDKWPIAVIEGDQQTSNDAARIRETGVASVQVNTGKGCHLDAEMVAQALDHLEPPLGGILFIENVGNLVCPAGFDLGEARRVVLASVTEGEDKPLKYPDMFASSDAMIVSKADLLPHLDFDVAALISNARKIRPRLDVLTTSATGAPGLDVWLAWLQGLHGQFRVAAE
ncbi:MAG: hydrogenase nickel incorporation protein HypB [Pseudomonadota bacterium]